MSDDLDEGLDLEGSNFDEFEKKDKTLGDLWRDNPLIKVAIIGGAALAIFGTIMLFGGDEKAPETSFVPAGSDITAPPGTEEATPAYVSAVEEQNEQRIEEAMAQGGSALPTPIDPPQGRLSVPEQQEEAEDPLQRWRQLQEERLQRELQKSQEMQPAPVPDGAVEGEAVQALADVMAQQMQVILEGQTSETGMQAMNMTDPFFRENAEKKLQEEAREEAEANGASGTGDDFFEDEELENLENMLMPAGEIVYAQLLVEANTDVPGPVLALIVSSPLAGSKVLGTFEESNELLVLNFDTIVYNDEAFDIDGIALDPKTTLPGMATDVDHHYFKRIILPMAAAFVEGAATAISESGLTTVTIEGEAVAEETEETDTNQEIAAGVEEAGQELREILEEMADETEVTVRIAAGTPLGILFLEPVIEGGSQSEEEDQGNMLPNPLATTNSGN